MLRVQGTWAYIKVDSEQLEAADIDKRDFLILKEQVIGEACPAGFRAQPSP